MKHQLKQTTQQLNSTEEEWIQISHDPSKHLFFRYVALFPLLLRREEDKVVFSAPFLLREMDGRRLRVGRGAVI